MKNRTSYFLLLPLLFLVVYTSEAQLGGRSGYSFVGLPVSARLAAIGGVNVSVMDKDVSMGYANPALWADSTHHQVSMTYQPFYSDIKRSTLFVNHSLKDNKGNIGVGINYLSYGKMDQTDATGNNQGQFRASDYSLLVGYANRQGPFYMGVNAKFMHSQLESYGASAVALDLGGVYKHPTQQLTVGLTMKNIGIRLSDYMPGDPVKLPFEVQVGATYKPEHMPLRLSLTFQQLQNWNLVYNDPSYNVILNLDGTKTPKETTFGDQFLRHMVVGGEFILAKSIHFRFGYNFLARRELRIDAKSGGAGLSWGFMIRAKKFDFGFSRAYYHIAGGTSYFTLAINVEEWRKK
ncbi:MAG: type IX secretion system protein PorQ [Cytophagaceae bacterium]